MDDMNPNAPGGDMQPDAGAPAGDAPAMDAPAGEEQANG